MVSRQLSDADNYYDARRRMPRLPYLKMPAHLPHVLPVLLDASLRSWK